MDRTEICRLLNRQDERDCERRYQYCKSVLKGFNHWSQDEENLLHLLVQKFEGKRPNWRIISNQIATRTVAAIKTHWRAMRQRENRQDKPLFIDFPKNFLLSSAQQEGNQYFGLDCEPIPTCMEATDRVLSHFDDLETKDITDEDDSHLEFRRNDETLQYSTNQIEFNELHNKDVTCDKTHWQVPSLYTSSSLSSSNKMTPESSFYLNTTGSSDHCESLETETTTRVHDCIKTLVRHNSTSSATSFDSCSTVNELDEDDLILSFIETFGCMDDEEAQAGPDHAPLPYQNMSPSDGSDSKSALFEPIRIHQGSKRIHSSWEKAKNSLPLRFQNRKLKKISNRKRQLLEACTMVERKKRKKVRNERSSTYTKPCESCLNSKEVAGEIPIAPTNQTGQAPNMFVYLPRIYTSTAKKTIVYSPNHPSMAGLSRPPPGFRLIQAPALISPAVLSKSVQNFSASTAANNSSSPMSSTTASYAVNITSGEMQNAAFFDPSYYTLDTREKY